MFLIPLFVTMTGMAYRATAHGMTNATMILKYGVETTTSKLPIGDSISRVYAFNIQPTTTSALTNQQHQKQQPLQIQTTRSGTNFAAANTTSAKTSIPVSSNASSYSGDEKNNTIRALSVSTHDYCQL